jgi:hypothetical protein
MRKEKKHLLKKNKEFERKNKRNKQIKYICQIILPSHWKPKNLKENRKT